MKRKLLVFLVLFHFLLSGRAWANSETVLAATSDFQTTDPSRLGWVTPCSSIRFIVEFTVPVGYTTVKQFDWYANNVLVKSTTNASDIGAIVVVTARAYSLYCKVTYVNSGTGAVSAAYTSSSFTPMVRPAYLNVITQSGNMVSGCPSQVTFSTSEITGNSLIYSPPPSDFTIHWTIPSGWSFVSGNTGNSVTVLTDGITSGNVTATMLFYCSYAEPTSLAVSYSAATPPPVFSSSNPPLTCGSTQDYSINPMCGPSSYTYTIGQNADVVFTANHLQTLTTTSTTANVTLPAVGGNFLLSVVANYPNGVSSSYLTAAEYYGLPKMAIHITKTVGYTFFATATNDPNLSYNWAIDSHPRGGNPFLDEDVTCGVTHILSVYGSDACGTTNTASTRVYVTCNNGGPLSVGPKVTPNPVTGIMKVTLPGDGSLGTLTAGSGSVIKAIRIVDKSGRIVKKFEYGTGVQEANITTEGLSKDIYILQVFDGTLWTHREIIVR